MELVEYYDEDLTENRFFETLQLNFVDLYQQATLDRLTICVPRESCLGNAQFTLEDFENHIISPIEKDGKYYTLNAKELSINNKIITSKTGFSESREITILFEETYYNKNEESYRVLCISQMLEGGINHQDELLVAPTTYDECSELLKSIGSRVISKLHSYILDAKRKFAQLKGQPLNQQVDAASSLYQKCLQAVNNEPKVKQMKSSSKNFFQHLKIAIETYVFHNVYQVLFANICACLAEKNANLNKITHAVAHLQLKHFGIRSELEQNIPRARTELRNLELCWAPNIKFQCMKRVMQALSRMPCAAALFNEDFVVTTDDLLTMLVYLVIRTELPTWWAQFEYMRNFNFSKHGCDDEYGFYLASLEAALEHISSGDFEKFDKPFEDKGFVFPSTGTTLWNKQDSKTSLIDELFQLIACGQQKAVEGRLQPLSQDSTTETSLCHPLCECAKCRRLVDPKESLKGGATCVTVLSRNSMGHTALHVAAQHGRTSILSFLLHQQAPVNVVDYYGQTPLHLACQKGHQTATLLLIDRGASINCVDGDGNTPLHLATNAGHDKCVKALLYCYQPKMEQIAVNAVNEAGDTALHLAAKWGYGPIVQALLESEASCLIKNRRGQLPIDFAYNIDIINMLENAQQSEYALLSQMDRNALSQSKSTSSKISTYPNHHSGDILARHHQSSSRRRHSAVNVPQQKNTAHKSSVISNASVSVYASEREYYRSTSDYHHHSTSGNMGHTNVHSSYHRRVNQKSVSPHQRNHESVKSISNEANSESRLNRHNLHSHDHPSDHDCVLHCDSISHHDHVSHRDHLSHPDQLGGTSSTHGCESNLHSMKLDHKLSATERQVEKLLKAVADGDVFMMKIHLGWNTEVEEEDVDLRNHALCHPLCQCFKCAPLQSFLSASKTGIHLNSTNHEGLTALYVAAKCGRIQLGELLLKRGAYVDVQEYKHFKTPLLIACKHNHIEMMKLLLQSGANVNLGDDGNNTPLHCACVRGNETAAKLLFEYGAKVNIVNSRGESPLALAQRQGVNSLVQLLRSLSISLDNDDNSSQSNHNEESTANDSLYSFDEACNNKIVQLDKLKTTASNTNELLLSSVSANDSKNMQLSSVSVDNTNDAQQVSISVKDTENTQLPTMSVDYGNSLQLLSANNANDSQLHIYNVEKNIPSCFEEMSKFVVTDVTVYQPNPPKNTTIVELSSDGLSRDVQSGVNKLSESSLLICQEQSQGLLVITSEEKSPATAITNISPEIQLSTSYSEPNSVYPSSGIIPDIVQDVLRADLQDNKL